MKNLIQFSFRFTHDTSRLCLLRFGIGLDLGFGFMLKEGSWREKDKSKQGNTHVFKILSVDEKELFGCYKT